MFDTCLTPACTALPYLVLFATAAAGVINVWIWRHAKRS